MPVNFWGDILREGCICSARNSAPNSVVLCGSFNHGRGKDIYARLDTKIKPRISENAYNDSHLYIRACFKQAQPLLCHIYFFMLELRDLSVLILKQFGKLPLLSRTRLAICAYLAQIVFTWLYMPLNCIILVENLGEWY